MKKSWSLHEEVYLVNVIALPTPHHLMLSGMKIFRQKYLRNSFDVYLSKKNLFSNSKVSIPVFKNY
jgi:hypothetical protein